MALPHLVDVIVVGLGPVGATVGNLLGRYGVATLVVDYATEILTAPRAIALDNEALRVLQLAGLHEGAFETVAIPHVQMRSPIFGNYARATTAGQIDGHPKLVTFYQPDLERALREQLGNHPSVRVETGIEVTGIDNRPSSVHVDVRLPDGSTTQVEAMYVVGCDGANSFIRKALGLDFQGHTYAQDWLIVDAKGAPTPIDHIEFFCNHRRPAPHMPAPGGRQRWEFMLRPGETRELMERPEMASRLLEPWLQGHSVEIERLAVYRFHARVADRFSIGRVYLAGDAAHITPPFAGQGLVAGLRDAANLCWKLAWVINCRASPTILESYNTERRPHAKSMVGLAKFLGKLIMPRSLPVAFVAHGLMRLLELFPPTRRWFGNLEIKPKNTFRRGLFLRGVSNSRLVSGGTFPQGLVGQAEGDVVLSDEVLGPQLSLVGFGVDPAESLDAAARNSWLAAGGRFVQICHRGQRLHLGPFARKCEDVSGTFIPVVAPFGWTAVVRPDRTVMCDGPSARAGQLVSGVLALLSGTSRSPCTHGLGGAPESAAAAIANHPELVL